MQTPIGKKGKVGLGFSIINDQLGLTDETYFDIDFSYTVKTSEEGKLSFGIKAGGHLLDVCFDCLNQFNPNDALLQTNIDDKLSPNIGAGIYYRNSK